jgi:hypothetical protein
MSAARSDFDTPAAASHIRIIQRQNGANVRISRTFSPSQRETSAFFSIFSSHARSDFL